MCAVANVRNNTSALTAGSRITLGQCRPYEHCGQCSIVDNECPNMIVTGHLCACGQPITQGDLWHAAEDGALTCRYCRHAAPYLPEVLAEARSMPQPIALEDLWLACPWNPELTPIIVTHLRAAGLTVHLPDPQSLPLWERQAFELQ